VEPTVRIDQPLLDFVDNFRTEMPIAKTNLLLQDCPRLLPKTTLSLKNSLKDVDAV